MNYEVELKQTRNFSLLIGAPSMKQALEKFSEAFQRLNPNNLDQLDDIHLISEETRVKVMSICEESD